MSIPVANAPLLEGKKGLITGIANNQFIMRRGVPRAGRAEAPRRSLVSIDDVGVATAFLAHDSAKLITGQTLYIDGGYHIID